MKNVVIGSLVVLTGWLLACSSSSDGAPVTCAIGSLTGTWRVTYVETNGTCGKIADETIVLAAGKQEPGASACTYATNQISADRCRMDLDFTCPLNGVKGTQRWVGAMHQVDNGALTSSLSLSLSSPTLGACRSTYDVTWTQQ